MELLWLADYLGSETAALVYEKKSGKYKDYSRKFYGLIKENTDLEEKRQLIHRPVSYTHLIFSVSEIRTGDKGRCFCDSGFAGYS